MKALTCEMCGSNRIVKQDGMYVCQSCKTQYTVEEARKLLVEVEGTVDVQGTVKVDNSDRLDNLYQIARRAKENNNSENAAKYYDMILQEDPNSWEAQFYTVYYQAMNCNIANIYSAAVSIENCEATVFKLIKANVQGIAEKKKVVGEIVVKLRQIATMLFNVALNHYKGIDSEIRGNYAQEMLNRCCAAIDILYTGGTLIIDIFGNDFGKDYAAPCWEVGVEQHADLVRSRFFKDKEWHKNMVMSYVDKIKRYKVDYQPPELTKKLDKKVVWATIIATSLGVGIPFIFLLFYVFYIFS